jgi:hypothetical protein
MKKEEIKRRRKNMQNDIQILNNMLLLTVKEEIENRIPSRILWLGKF